MRVLNLKMKDKSDCRAMRRNTNDDLGYGGALTGPVVGAIDAGDTSLGPKQGLRYS